MSNRFDRVANGAENVHFSKAYFGDVQTSRMTAVSTHLTTFNAGQLVPIYCREVLPDETMSLDLDFVIRQTTLLTPTMGTMTADIYAFFVPNRIVNQSWKAVEGENYSGSWTSNSVVLAPLVSSGDTSLGSLDNSVKVPVGSLADYYGFPTQESIPVGVLSLCHDLKFRGYVLIWNEHFRDQNYQPPIPMSTLNVYQGFFSQYRNDAAVGIPVDGSHTSGSSLDASTDPNGGFAYGSIAHALYGSGHTVSDVDFTVTDASFDGHLNAFKPPLLVNKLHDYFTSVLPSPQKSLSDVMVPVSTMNGGPLPVGTVPQTTFGGSHVPLRFTRSNGVAVPGGQFPLLTGAVQGRSGVLIEGSATSEPATTYGLYPSNLAFDPQTTNNGLSFDISDLRMASAVQQYYEVLGRGGSRYRELVNSFFGISVDDPYSDIPRLLGHIRRDLDLYQTAQTSGSLSGSTPQGNLAAFGYTSTSGHLFDFRFIEHGYLHIFVTVRHKNIYSAYLSKDNFRRSALDFYTPVFANISEQPVYTYQINPFYSGNYTSVFGYQEAWAEYRYEPDYVTGLMRPGVEGSLSLWNYADDVDTSLVIADGDWLKSNSKEVLDRTLAVTSSVAPQFKAAFKFSVDKTLPMPTYSVPGMDII